MNPLRNPYMPGAGRQPPELAGRDDELTMFDVELERAAEGMSVRGFVLVGLRGVGKTVLLNAMRGRAIDAGWATAKIEGEFGTPLADPLATALTGALRGISRKARNRSRLDTVQAALSTLGLAAGADGIRLTVDPAQHRAASRAMQVNLTGLFTDLGLLARDTGAGLAVFIDELQDVPAADLGALCAACHEMGQLGYPVILVGAGLPNLPAVLSGARSYAERLFNYLPIDKLGTKAAHQALIAPAARHEVAFSPDALAALTAMTDRYAYFIQTYGQATWDAALGSPVTAEDVRIAEAAAERTLAVGFFGARYSRATPAERAYLHAMARVGDGAVATNAVARAAGRPIRSLSPLRDAVIRKGLVFSPERGLVDFSVPHFARYLRKQDHDAPPPRRHARPRTGAAR
ncbi:MAG TPA: ATP-binding protein [Frankiaceae bacterium]|nr:ATP-binding protein [Frankiaceae bacterium]